MSSVPDGRLPLGGGGCYRVIMLEMNAELGCGGKLQTRGLCVFIGGGGGGGS